DLNRLAVEKDFLFQREERIGGPGADRHRSLPASWCAHSVQHVFMRDHRRTLARAGADRSHDIATGYRTAGPGEVLVPSGVIWMDVGIDNVAERLGGELPDRRQNLVAQLGELRIDQQDALVAHLQGDV